MDHSVAIEFVEFGGMWEVAVYQVARGQDSRSPSQNSGDQFFYKRNKQTNKQTNATELAAKWCTDPGKGKTVMM